jgi:hypothetical protein
MVSGPASAVGRQPSKELRASLSTAASLISYRLTRYPSKLHTCALASKRLLLCRVFVVAVVDAAPPIGNRMRGRSKQWSRTGGNGCRSQRVQLVLPVARAREAGTLMSEIEASRVLLGGRTRWRESEVKAKRSTDESCATERTRRTSPTEVPEASGPRAYRTARCVPRGSMFVGRNRGGQSATAFLRTNFTLEVTAPKNGIKHGTARCELTPRVRAASTFPTQATRRWKSSKRVNPSRLDDGSFSRPARLGGLAPEGRNIREDQGGP